MKALFLSLTLLFASLAITLHGQDWSLQTAHLKKSVFRLESSEGKCSAVLINEKDNVVVTAAHCVPNKTDTADSIAVDEKHATVLRSNKVIDLAVLKVEEISGDALAVRKDDTTSGMPVAVAGYGFAAARLKYGFGWISDTRDNSLGKDRLFFSVVGVVPGDSGGAIVDQTGHLCSVLQGVIYSGPSMLAYGSPTSVVKDFIKSYLPKA